MKLETFTHGPCGLLGQGRGPLQQSYIPLCMNRANLERNLAARLINGLGLQDILDYRAALALMLSLSLPLRLIQFGMVTGLGAPSNDSLTPIFFKTFTKATMTNHTTLGRSSDSQ